MQTILYLIILFIASSILFDKYDKEYKINQAKYKRLSSTKLKELF